MKDSSKNGFMINYSIKNRVFDTFLVVFMVLMFIVMVYPYLNVVAKAFNEGYDTIRGGITVYPRIPTIQNFIMIFYSDNFLSSSFISVTRVLLGTIIALFVQFSSAYSFKKKNLKYRSMLLFYLIIPMFFGGGLIPQYLLYAKLGLLNNFLVYIIPSAFSVFNMVIIRTYLYTSIPDSFEESAKLDGANEIVIMFYIIIPLSMPILATIALWTAVGHWNDWITTLYFITKERLYTMQYVLMRLLKQYEELAKIMQKSIENGVIITEENVQKTKTESIQAAQIVLTTIPIIIVYPFLQKYFIKGIMIGALKD